MRLGQEDVGAEPTDTTAREAYDLLTKGFGAGTNGPFLISVQLSKPAQPDQKNLNTISQNEKQLQQQQQQIEQQALAEGATQQQAQQEAQQQTQSQSNELANKKKQAEQPATDPRLQTLRTDLQKTKGVKSVTQPLVNQKGTAAVYTLIPTTSPSDLETEDLVSRLRDSTIPKATKGQGMTAFVGGTTAAYVDLADKITSKLPLVILVVAALSFLVLLLGFRSLLLPTQAAVMNLVSVGAAYGVLTLVFQEGFASSLIGLDGSIPVVSFVPLIMFAILFGLSTDYQVFLLTQIQEHFKEGKGARQTVIEGLGYSGRIIGAAAAVMFCVFASFVLNGDPTIKQFGLGLATAVAIDALVVCFFVPALIVTAGQVDALAAPLARQDPAAHQHRGVGVLRRRAGPERRAGTRAGAGGESLSEWRAAPLARSSRSRWPPHVGPARPPRPPQPRRPARRPVPARSTCCTTTASARSTCPPRSTRSSCSPQARSAARMPRSSSASSSRTTTAA